MKYCQEADCNNVEENDHNNNTISPTNSNGNEDDILLDITSIVDESVHQDNDECMSTHDNVITEKDDSLDIEYNPQEEISSYHWHNTRSSNQPLEVVNNDLLAFRKKRRMSKI